MQGVHHKQALQATFFAHRFNPPYLKKP